MKTQCQNFKTKQNKNLKKSYIEAICGKWESFFLKVAKKDEWVKDAECDLSKEMYKDQRVFFLTPPSPAKSKSNMKEFYQSYAEAN